MTKKTYTSTARIPSELVEALAKNRAVLFAGAGISRSLSARGRSGVRGLPDWRELLLALVKRAGSERLLLRQEITELKRAIQNGRYTFVAEALHAQMDKSFHTALKRIIDIESAQPNERHKLLVELPFVAILTTNYDKLFEKAFSDAGEPMTTFTPAEATAIITALVEGKRFILKAHGDIDKVETLVLSEGHYRDLLHRQPAYLVALQTVFLMKTVLFIGTSLSDPDVRLVLETVKETFRGEAPLHYALVPESSAGRLERNFWRKFYGIELLVYRDHAYVDHFLAELKKEVRVLAPRLVWRQQILEAKWYPSDTTLKQLRMEMETKVPKVLKCGPMEDKAYLKELNILFDTPSGSLYKSNVNLSIKVLAERRGNALVLTARWVLIKLRGFPTDPEKMWDRNQEPQDQEKVFTATSNVNKIIQKIVSLRMPKTMNKLLRTAAENTRANVKPVLIISVLRDCWFFTSQDPKWKPRLFISRVTIHPYSRPWLMNLYTFDQFQQPSKENDWSWQELEIEVEETDEGDNRQYYTRFDALEQTYKLNPTNSQNRPLAKYHHAVKVLREFHRFHAQSQLCEDWLPFLKRDS